MKVLLQQLRSRFFHLSLFTRINLAIICITIAELVLLSLILIRLIIHPSLEKDRLLSLESCDALSSTTKDKYSVVYNQSQLMLTDNHIASRLVAADWRNHTSVSLEDARFIRDYFDALFFSDPDILDAVIVSADGQYCFVHSSNSSRRLDVSYNYLSLHFMSSLLVSDSIIGIYLDTRQYYANSSSEPVITFAAKIYNPVVISSPHPVCFLMINYPVSTFSNSFQQYSGLSSSLYIVNGDNTIVYSNNEDSLQRSFDTIPQDNCDIVSIPVGIYGIRVISIIPDDLIRTQTIRLVATMLVVLIPIILLIMLFTLLMNHRYHRRVHDLADAMERVSGRELNTRIETICDDELGRLAHQFNQMCESLDTYIDMHYQAEIGRQTAELNALQAQINPHFLFNSIEGIRMHAVSTGNPDLAEMLMQLGNLFRWMIHMEKNIVYLEDEIDYVESYLYLQQMRYEDSFKVRTDIDNDALYLGVPKFTLQPIVENALLHGLKDNSLIGNISIRAFIQHGMLKLIVTDNGSGISPQQLDRLMQHINCENASSEEFGIGIQNVQSRIHLLFGKNYGITIVSQPGEGTTVEITLPAKPKKEMEENVSNRTR